jgi:hypothetical protein
VHLNLGALPQPTTEPAGPTPVVIAETLGSIRIPGAAPATQPFITGQLSSRGKTKSPTMMAVRVNEQGQFQVREVPPGKYVLEFQVYDPARIGQGQELASLIRFVDVLGPGKVELGELRLLPGPWR